MERGSAARGDFGNLHTAAELPSRIHEEISMPQTTTASAVFPNRHAARRAAERLAEGGFARNSIDLNRLYSDDDDYEVSVRVREGNLRRAEDLLHARPDVHAFAGQGIDMRPLMLVAGAVIVGAVGYTLYAMRRPQNGRGQSKLHLPSVW
jgi:hypothetical protein